MPEEFEGDLAGAVFWGADMKGAMFRDVDMTGVRISHAWLIDVEVDAWIDRVVINGVDVTAYVNERDPWYPLRAMLRPDDPAGMRETWALLEAAWAATTVRAFGMGGDALHRSVDGEWSFVQTLRHMVFATDKWFTVPVLGGAFAPIGLPNRGSVDVGFPGLDLTLAPTADEALAVRRDRAARFGAFLAAADTDDLDREVDVMENGPHPLRECIFTVFEEEFWHLRYARRDLDVIDG